MGVVSRWVWVESMGVARGCKRGYINFLILLIPTCFVSVLFASSIPTFSSLCKKSFVLYNYYFATCSYMSATLNLLLSVISCMHTCIIIQHGKYNVM